jgi:UDP-N-acetylmuramate-alanine ligase
MDLQANMAAIDEVVQPTDVVLILTSGDLGGLITALPERV